jgi:alpha-glucosidase
VPGKRTRPFDFQLHQFNQSQPGIVPFLERLRNVMNEFGPDKFAVAEVVNSLAEMKAFTAGPSRLQTAYGFDFLYADAMTPLVFANAMANWPSAPNEDAPGEGWPSWAFSNHDAPRVASRWSGTRDTDQTARFAMLMLIALRGNIFVYQGEELGLPQADVPFERLQDPEAIANWPLTLGRDGARTPMPWNDAAPHAGFSAAEPWLPVPEDHRRRAVNVQEKDPASMLNWTRQLLALRKAEPALRLGDLKWIEDANLAAQSLVAFDRVHEGRTLRCVFNVGVERAVFSGVAERMLTSVGDVGADYLAPLSGFIAERAD